MQPVELVALMSAIIYSGRAGKDPRDSRKTETRQSAVEEAWHLWHLVMDEWSDPGARRPDPDRMI